MIEFLTTLGGQFLFGVVIGALAITAFWRAAFFRYMSNPANARKIAEKLRRKGY